jgi:hypothetical protein
MDARSGSSDGWSLAPGPYLLLRSGSYGLMDITIWYKMWTALCYISFYRPLSLSIEQDRRDHRAGTTKRNEFFCNALHNLVQITNSLPFIEIGADSEDRTDFSYDVEVYHRLSVCCTSQSTDLVFQYKKAIFPARSRVTLPRGD